MKLNKLVFNMLFAFMALMPFVLADLKGPSPAFEFASLILVFAIVGGFIVGAFFLIRFIVRKIRHKK